MLEFFSYNLHFTMFLVGPSCTYYEFIQFIDGNNMKVLAFLSDVVFKICLIQ